MIIIKTLKLYRQLADQQKLIEQLRNENINLANDLNYHKAILDGSWPSAVAKLNIALAAAKQKENKNNVTLLK